MKISICIPCYKRIDYLRRLLDSIVVQTFKDFEVIVTDDSPGEEVEEFCKQYASKMELHYFKNDPNLGTPENWNEGIRKAKGDWIKVMHDDDWFADENSLQDFVDATRKNPDARFLFSAYQNIFEDGRPAQQVFISSLRWKALLLNPVTLFSTNGIGPPSVILHKNDRQHWYDRTVKWVVDIDFYIRYLEGTKPVFIDKVLVNVGVNKEQVTQSTFRVREVEIPENFHLLNKVGTKQLRDLFVYDAWWRLLRNLEVKSVGEIRTAGYEGAIPLPILSMLNWQKNLPSAFLKIGALSKTFMFLNFIRNFTRI